jgi:hypothetical protein
VQDDKAQARQLEAFAPVRDMAHLMGNQSAQGVEIVVVLCLPRLPP